MEEMETEVAQAQEATVPETSGGYYEEEVKVSSIQYVLATLAGIAAGVVGGLIWGFIGAVSKYEIGYLAVGIGFLCGFAVLLASKGTRKVSFMVIASVCSVAGLLLGKYYMYLMTESSAGYQASFFSIETIQLFFSVLPKMSTFYDLLWIALAIITAAQTVAGRRGR